MKKIFPIFLSILFGGFNLFALPSGCDVQKGSAVIRYPDGKNNMVIENGKDSIIHWKDFSIKENENVTFKQPDNLSSILNRVMGSNLSELYGALLSNGKVYVINPNGIVIGPNAKIETNAFVASSLDVLDESFLKGKDLLFSGKEIGDVINLGKIACPYGEVFLIGKNVKNEGEINANKIALASGLEVLIKPEESESVWIKTSFKEDENVVENTGVLKAISCELKGGYSPYLHAIKNAGKINIISTEEENGKIFIKCENSKCILEKGSVTAEKQAFIDISANKIFISSEGEISLGKESILQISAKEELINEGKITAPKSNIIVKAISEEKLGRLYQIGRIDVSDEEAGKICIDADFLIQGGYLSASGNQPGDVKISCSKNYIETSLSQIDVSSPLSKGRNIEIFCGKEGRLFTSGSHLSSGKQGGKVSLLGKEVVLCAANVDVSGEEKGGEIFLGGLSKEDECFTAKKTYINHATNLNADSENGEGGNIFVWSDKETKFYGNFSAKGKEKGGTVEISSKGNLSLQRHKEDFQQEEMQKEIILLDPNDIIISNTGNLPFYELQDPLKGDGANFGSNIKLLPNGNVVVTKPSANLGGTFLGAVFLFNATNGALISTVTGGQDNDRVGVRGCTVLTTGDYVINSEYWNNGGTSNAGAITWCNQNTGLSGVVLATNSLHGTHDFDRVGHAGITTLTNGNYVVNSNDWDKGPNPADVDVGAVTWVSAQGYPINSSSRGAEVSVNNSLYGSSHNDSVGDRRALALNNGNYVCSTPNWDNGGATRAGAVTLMDGATGFPVVNPSSGFAVTTNNSLYGTTINDQVGYSGVASLKNTNGDYVVRSLEWNDTVGGNNRCGAATWVNGKTGIPYGETVGNVAVSQSNSLYGTSFVDQIGRTVIPLNNGNYVVASLYWDDTVSGNTNVGCAVWCDGNTGRVGPVTRSICLYGQTQDDYIGSSVVSLNNNHGDYLVCSSYWTPPATPLVTNAGCVVWCDGETGRTGAIDETMCIHGTRDDDRIAYARKLNNGNYVVHSPEWDKGPNPADQNVGGAMLVDGDTGIPIGGTSQEAEFSLTNTLHGTQAGDRVGASILPLTNSNYVVISPSWKYGAISGAGAATWVDGTTGIAKNETTIGAEVTTSNSIYCDQSAYLGDNDGFALENGNYVVPSYMWSSPPYTENGCFVWGDGNIGSTGVVSFANSIVGQSDFSGAQEAPSNQNYFFCEFIDEDGGTVRVGLCNPHTVPANFGGGWNMNVASDFISESLKQGYNLVLNANNDITITDGFDATGGGIGSATFNAARNITINDTCNFGGSTATFQPGADYHTASPTKIPDGVLFINADLLAPGGTLNLSPAGRSDVMSIATIAAEPPGGTLNINCANLNIGDNEAFTALCDLNITATSYAKVADIVALDSLTITSPTLEVHHHGRGFLLDSSGNLYETDNTHIIARNTMPAISGDIIVSGSGLPVDIMFLPHFDRSTFYDKLHYASYVLGYDLAHYLGNLGNYLLSLGSLGQLQRNFPFKTGGLYTYNMEWIWPTLVGQTEIAYAVTEEFLKVKKAKTIDEYILETKEERQKGIKYFSYPFYWAFIFENEVK